MTRNEAILREYVAGVRVASLVEKYGLSERRIYGIISKTADRTGTPLPVRRKGRHREPLVAGHDVAMLYALGKTTLDEVAAHLGCCRQTAAKAVRRAGYHNGRRPQFVTADDGARVKNPLYDIHSPGNIYQQIDAASRDGTPIDQIAASWNIATNTAKNYVRRWRRHAQRPPIAPKAL